MKVLVVLENYLPHIGGVETVFQNISENLVKLGHDVTIVTHRLKGSKKYEVMNGVKVYRVRCLENRYLFTFFAIPKVFKLAKTADIIHTTTFNAAFPAWVASKLRNKPGVITVHEVWVGKWTYFTDMSRINSFIHDTLERFIYFLSFDRYVCVSDSTKKALTAVKKVDKKITVVYNGLDYQHWNPELYDRNRARRKLRLKDEFLIMSYGRPGPSKGMEYIVKAMPAIVKKSPRTKLLLLLSKDKEYISRYLQLKELIKTLKIVDHVIFHDSVSYKELPNYHKASDCVVVPSLSEGFGYAAAESCAMGIPCVVTDNASLPEVVSGTYELVPPKDPEAIADAVLKIIHGKSKKRPMKRFEWKKSVENYIKIYKDILN